MADAQALEAMADDLGDESVDVDGDVGQLGHRGSVPARASLTPALSREREWEQGQPMRWIAARIAADVACQPTIAALRRDHRQRRRLELGEVALGAVLDHQAGVAAVVGLAHRRLHADLGGDAREDQVGDALRVQDLVDPRRPEHALAGLSMTISRPCGASAGMMSAPGSPSISTRPIGPGSPMRKVGLPRMRLAGGQSDRSAAMRLARVHDRPARGFARPRAARRSARSRMQRRHVVAERGAEAAGLDEVALHVDDDERGLAGREAVLERRRGGDSECRHAASAVVWSAAAASGASPM